MRVLAVRESSWLNSAPEDVWRLIESLEDWPTWNRGVNAARWSGSPGWRVGNRFRLVPAVRPFSPRTGGEVRVVEPPRRLGWEGRFLGFTAEFTLDLAREGAGTRVDFASHYRGLAARLAGHAQVSRRIASFQRGFLESLRHMGERVVGKSF